MGTRSTGKVLPEAITITRRTRLGWAWGDESRPTMPMVTGTMRQIHDARHAALTARKGTLGESADFLPAFEVIWYRGVPIGYGIEQILALSKLVDDGPHGERSVTLCRRR